MIKNIRLLALGAGAVGVAGTAAFFGLSGSKPPNQTSARSGADIEICLKSNLFYAAAAEPRCYQRSDLAKLRDAPIIDQQAEAVTVVMTDPESESTAPAAASTCRDYDQARREGRLALSTREMRREAYFLRGCGAITMLLKSAPAKVSHFLNGSLRAEDVASLGVDGLLRLGESVSTGAGAAPQVDPLGAAAWRISAGGQNVTLQEIANADFDDDGIEEILVFLTTSPDDGTAISASLALVEKESAGEPFILTTVKPDAAPGGPSGAL